jgi:polysaccharide biosynthesis transport protein
MLDSNQSAPENNMRDMLQTLWRSKLTIIAIAVLATAGAVGHFFVTAPKFKAQAVIMVKSPNKEQLIKGGEGQAEYTLPTSVELLKSYPLADATVQRLMASPDSSHLELLGTRGRKGKTVAAAPNPQYARRFAEGLLQRIDAENIRDTNLIEVSVSSPYSDEAALLTNTLCEVYQEKNAEWSAAQDMSVSKTIEQQITQQEKKVRETEQALRDFMQNNEVYEPTGNVTDLQRSYTSASTEYDTNRVQYEILKKQRAFIEQTLTNEERTFSRNMYDNIANQLHAMRESIRNKENAYIALTVQKGPNTPEVEAARKDLTNLKSEYDQINRTKLAGEIANSGNAQKYRFDLLASKMQVNVRLAELDNSAMEYQRLKDFYRDQLNQLPAKQIAYAKLSLDHDVANKTYAFLKEKLDEARIKAASNVGGVVIIKKAYAPVAPESPNLLQNIAIGLGGGIILGALVVVMKEKMV